MMSCEEFTDRVTDYLEGNVPAGRRIGMWLHTLLCRHCRRYVEQMERTAGLLHSLEPDEEEQPSSELKDELVGRFREREDSPS